MAAAQFPKEENKQGPQCLNPIKLSGKLAKDLS